MSEAVGLEVLGIPVVFVLFGLMLLGVAVFHHHTLRVALIGLVLITGHQLAFASFDGRSGLPGLLAHLEHEWVALLNLFGLLVGFAQLAEHFVKSRLPELLPELLPDDWKGGLVLLALVFIASGFLDNIAAAMIGATIAASVFRNRVHIAYVAALVGAANAGGTGSVIGDTTTTMMWIEGVPPLSLLPAYVAAVVAFAFFSIPAALVQHRFAPIVKDARPSLRLDRGHLATVFFVLAAAVATNIVVNLHFAAQADAFPFLAAAIWVAVLLAAPLRAPHWSIVPETARSSLFLIALVAAASMMPVDRLPPPSWLTSLALGFVSAVFDNIPLTKLALDQGGYDWDLLAYAVGFGGSLTWFGSSAGVAASIIFPESRSLVAWLRHGWPLAPAYVAGFFALLWLCGWSSNGLTAH